MTQYTHRVSGIYHDGVLARQAFETLRDGGFPDEQLQLMGPKESTPEVELEPEGGGQVRSEIVKDTLVGAGVGGSLGVAGSAALAIANTALLATNPVLGVLTIVGYAAAVGGVAGALGGALKVEEPEFLRVVEHALKKDYWVVVALAKDADEEQRAMAIISKTTAEPQVSE